MLKRSAVSHVLRWGCASLIASICVYVAVLVLGESDWVPIDATILSSQVVPQNPGGPPNWGLEVQFRTVGSPDECTPSRHVVFSHDEVEAVEARQRLLVSQQSAGETYRLYHHPHDPCRTSLVADGGLQGFAVAAALLTPLVVLMLGVFTIAYQRRQKP